MAALDFEKNRKKEKLKTNLLFVLSGLIFLVSYMNGFRLDINLSFLICLCFGIMNGIIDSIVYFYQIDFFEWNEIEYQFRFQKFLRVVFLSIIYTSIYNLILLPPLGLGIIEIIFGILFLLSIRININTNLKNSKNRYIVGVPNLIIFQCTLAFLKILSFFLPENFFRVAITGNDTLRIILAAITLLFVIYGIVSLKRKVLQDNSTAKSNGTKIFTQIQKLFGKLFYGISSPMIVLVIIGGGIILLLLTGNKIIEDILKFLDKTLGFAFSTGKYTFKPAYLLRFIFGIAIFGLYKYLFCISINNDNSIKPYFIEYIKEQYLDNKSEDEKTKITNKIIEAYNKNNLETILNHKIYINDTLQKEIENGK